MVAEQLLSGLPCVQRGDRSCGLQQRAANLVTTIARGAKVTLDATIKAMPPGTYFLDFTMVRTGGAVFTDHQVPPVGSCFRCSTFHRWCRNSIRATAIRHRR